MTCILIELDNFCLQVSGIMQPYYCTRTVPVRCHGQNLFDL
jgi:hypothetical protein